jgi:hypothetical protein
MISITTIISGALRHAKTHPSEIADRIALADGVESEAVESVSAIKVS